MLDQRHDAQPELAERTLRFCERKQLFARGDRVLVATGGGAASLGALALLRLGQERLGLASVGAVFVLVREDADDEAAETGRVVRSLGVDFHVVTGDRTGSWEHSCTSLVRALRGTRLVTGHTREDAAERVLGQLVSGAGLSGLRPFALRRRDGLRRPLLELFEHEAATLARDAGLEPTVLEPAAEAKRRFRRSVVARLRAEVPGSDRALLELARQVMALRRRLQKQARSAIVRLPSGIEIPADRCDGIEAWARATEAAWALGLRGRAARRLVQALERALSVGERQRPPSVLLADGLWGSYLPGKSRAVLRLGGARIARLPSAGP